MGEVKYMSNRTGSLVPYPGGKYYLASKIVKLLPAHRIYAEPFAGAANVLFAKPCSPIEVINDIDESMINLYTVLKDVDMYHDLVHRLHYTLYSRAEFVRALGILRSSKGYASVDKAWARIVASLQSFAGLASGKGEWGRDMRKGSLTLTFFRKPMQLHFYHERLRSVRVSCMDGIDFITAWDGQDTLFYIDPPYILSTRRSKKIYRYEQPDEYHERLVQVLLNIKGKAVVSHYLHPIYQELEKAGYARYEFRALAHMVVLHRAHKNYGKRERIRDERLECLWVKSDI